MLDGVPAVVRQVDAHAGGEPAKRPLQQQTIVAAVVDDEDGGTPGHGPQIITFMQPRHPSALFALLALLSGRPAAIFVIRRRVTSGMPGNGLSFCTALHPLMPPPKRHLVLKVRAHHVSGFNLQGDRASEIGGHFASARGAVQAVRSFARRSACTANITVYTPDGEIFCVKEVIRP